MFSEVGWDGEGRNVAQGQYDSNLGRISASFRRARDTPPRSGMVLSPTPMSFSYKALPGYFLQTDLKAEPGTIGPNPDAFGLIDGGSKTCWSDFEAKITKLQQDAPPGTKYVVCWFGRHGQGWHNVGESKYGSKEWDEKWSLLNGDGEIIWGPDPELTDLGKLQASQAHQVWKTELARENPVPLPTRLFSSPFSRAALTLDITFSDILTHKKDGSGLKPYVMENLREMNGEHTCDKRSPKSRIHKMYPEFEFEPGFTEEASPSFCQGHPIPGDELWTPDHRETVPEIDKRVKSALDEIIGSLLKKEEIFISITAHSGMIASALRVLGHREYLLPTGGVIPLVIQATESKH
ncbi:Phosphoglycerate mutase-like protein [Rhizoctonia solani]|uniref:Phosphoglycerate mutase-like protein n=1 Tax=Rhizoctonia solani TaxID=456999 RepID=A0A8H7H0R2_9AGAM|nr:Phosphoglycerate mutase-like protein [Rhizoctonia solani]